MSRYSGNGDQCPHCGMRYGDFRTGLSYDAVFDMLKDNSEDPADWRYKRRGTVLGHWHQLKQELWERHQAECLEQKKWERRQAKRRRRVREVARNATQGTAAG